MANETKKDIKVFCGRCKHFWHNVSRPTFEWGKGMVSDEISECKHPNNIVAKHDYIKEWTEEENTPDSINRFNNCEWFEGK
jgi:hypothetical protein